MTGTTLVRVGSARADAPPGTRAQAEQAVLENHLYSQTANWTPSGPLTAPPALSQAAYLWQLRKYALEALRLAGQPLSATWLEDSLLQDFSRIADGGADAEGPVPQVRLCIEVLRRHLPEADRKLPSSYFRATYEALLRGIGTSYGELRQVSVSTDNKERAALAERLGIRLGSARPDTLEQLTLPLSGITEEKLQNLFGLPKLLAGAATAAVAPASQFAAWRHEYQADVWFRSDWPEAPAPVGAPPLIDPDLVSKDELMAPEPDKPAGRLWQARRSAVDDRLQELNRRRQEQPHEPTAFVGMLEWSGLTIHALRELQGQRKQGQDISGQLRVMGLTVAAFEQLVAMDAVLKAYRPDYGLSDEEWRAVIAILARMYKSTQYGTWRDEEKQAGIALSPAHFKLTGAARTLPDWLASAEQRQEWEERLRTRSEQVRQVDVGLTNLVQTVVDEETLAGLRDALLLKLPPETGADLPAKAGWFAERFLVDAAMAATLTTTRVDQAIQTLQGLLWGVRTGQLRRHYPNLSLDENVDFGQDWPWLGAYETWRTAALTRLYPEFFMQPHLRPWQSPPFRELVKATGTRQRLSPQAVREVASTYGDAFRRVCGLELGAACQAETNVAPAGSSTPIYQKFVHMFARHAESGTVYWSMTDPDDQSFRINIPWTVVPGLGFVKALIGAVAYTMPSTVPYLFLFVRLPGDGVGMIRYHLQNLTWDKAPTELFVPAPNETVVILQYLEDAPPALIKVGKDQILKQAQVTVDGTGLQPWVEVRFRPIPDVMRPVAVFHGKSTYLVMQQQTTPRAVVVWGSTGSSWVHEGDFRGIMAHASGSYVLLALPNSQDMWAMNITDPGATMFAVGGVKCTASLVPVVNTCRQPLAKPLALWNDERGILRAPVEGEPQKLTLKDAHRLALRLDGPFDFSDLLTSERVRARTQQLKEIFSRHQQDPVAMDYLIEAYCLVPIQLAMHLQWTVQYVVALAWLGTVYNDAEPLLAERSVIPERAELRSEAMARAVLTDWLRDPFDAHCIGATRDESLTRFVVVSLARCVIAYADAEFTVDTAESLARARTLYVRAVSLLEGLRRQPTSALVVAARRSGDLTELLADPAVAATADMAGAICAELQLPVRTPSFLPSGALLGEDTPNPLLQPLYLYASVNLEKLRTGWNFAGMERQADQAAGGARVIKPTPYRYQTLIERARHLVQLAQQVEGSLLGALEKRDAEAYNLLCARQDLSLAQTNVQLQQLRVSEAEGGVKLAALTYDRAVVQERYYAERLTEGSNTYEKQSLVLMTATGLMHSQSASASFLAASLPASISIGFPPSASMSPQGSAQSVAAGLSSMAESTNVLATIASTMASYERRAQEWQLQRAVAVKDEAIGEQQTRTAIDHLQVTRKEYDISSLEMQNAGATVAYLATKFTNVELYDWMSKELEAVYRFFLQQATSVVQVAADQLAFERQETLPITIRADYWEMPAAAEGDSQKDRHGLMGSEWLQQDIYRLDQYAFSTNKLRLQLIKNVSLARLSPMEFQQLRETGVMRFVMPMELFDRDFPGHYLRLMSRVRVSVIALVPAIDSIKATLGTTGISRTVVETLGGFENVVLQRPPQTVALSSARDATGLFELQPAQSEEMLRPFEGMGVEAMWEFRLPKPANPFDFTSLADVVLTFEYTALDSPAYRAQVISTLDPNRSADRPFSFRGEFPDAWYGLHNPEQSPTSLRVRFETAAADFPPNLTGVKIQQIVLYFRRAEGEQSEVTVAGLTFTPKGGQKVELGEVQSSGGIISTRHNWTGGPIFGLAPVGAWELALKDTPELRALLKRGGIADILFVITYQARTADWPM